MKHIFNIVFIFIFCLLPNSYGEKLDGFDFSDERISFIRNKAEIGDHYFQGLYGGLMMWGYVVPTAVGKTNDEAATSALSVAEKDAGDDWFAAAGETSAPAVISNDDWIGKSAQAGDPIGLYFKANRLGDEKGLRDLGEIRDLWRKAINGLDELGKGGDPVALTLCGLMHENGYGVKAADNNAIEYYRKGVEKGSALAAHRLSLVLFKSATTKDVYEEILDLNQMARKGYVKEAPEFHAKVLDAAEKLFAAKAVPFLPFLLPGQYHFSNFIVKAIIRIVGLIGLVVGGLFGWFIFPWCLAPIKLLIHSPMEIFIDRIVGVFGFSIGGCALLQVTLVKLLC